MKTRIWIRLLLVLLLGAMLLGVVACDKDKGKKDPTDIDPDEDQSEDLGEVEYPFVIEDCGSNGNVGRFNMATRTDRCAYIDTEDLDGTIINDAVYERNALIEELFNVEITQFEAGSSEATQYYANITNDIMGGVGAYDCTVGWDG